MREEFSRGMSRAITAGDRTPAFILNFGTIRVDFSYLSGSDSAPSLCLDFGLFARGHPDRDLWVYRFLLRGGIFGGSRKLPVRRIVSCHMAGPVTAGGGAL